ncbi:hypothetical protein BD413DRAFT_89205 [Trametes elegans]|nr:hypothetical protein BD413DRAFT_89205 [Trametes elegans]
MQSTRVLSEAYTCRPEGVCSIPQDDETSKAATSPARSMYRCSIHLKHSSLRRRQQRHANRRSFARTYIQGGAAATSSEQEQGHFTAVNIQVHGAQHMPRPHRTKRPIIASSHTRPTAAARRCSSRTPIGKSHRAFPDDPVRLPGSSVRASTRPIPPSASPVLMPEA